MKFKASIDIMPHTELLDPQGKAVNNSLHKMGQTGIEKVRIGKRIELQIEAKDASEAEQIVKESCETLLVNKIMEQYQYNLSAIEG